MNEKYWRDGKCPYCGSEGLFEISVEKIYLTEYHEYLCSSCKGRYTDNYEPTRVMNPDADDEEYFDVETDYGSCKNGGFLERVLAMARKVIKFEVENGKYYITDQEAEEENFRIKLRKIKKEFENSLEEDDCVVKLVLIKVRDIFGQHLTKNTLQKIIEEIENV